MHVPLWALRLAPYIGGLLLAGGAYLWAYNRGVSAERATWQAARAELLRLRTERANDAAQHLAQISAAAPQTAVKEIVRVETHWRDRPVRECFDTDLVRSLEEARSAVRRSAATGSGRD